MLKIEGTETEREYLNALNTLRPLLSECNKTLTEEFGRNFMVMITSRIKTSESIVKKLKRKGYPVDMETAENRLNDIAGMRIVCRYQDDIYRIRRELYQLPDFFVIKEKDFVKHPKKSGYRSLHIIVGVPFKEENGGCRKVEIQIRTVVMHLWAELEHEKCYKNHRKNKNLLYQTLKHCAKLGRRLDLEMQNARNAADAEEIWRSKSVVKADEESAERNADDTVSGAVLPGKGSG